MFAGLLRVQDWQERCVAIDGHTRDIAQHICAKMHLNLTVLLISRPIGPWKKNSPRNWSLWIRPCCYYFLSHPCIFMSSNWSWYSICDKSHIKSNAQLGSTVNLMAQEKAYSTVDSDLSIGWAPLVLFEKSRLWAGTGFHLLSFFQYHPTQYNNTTQTYDSYLKFMCRN